LAHDVFLSSVSGEQVALQYSGAAEGKPVPMVLEMRVGPVARGACILELSQYPKEVEYLFPPMCLISPGGQARVSISAASLCVRVVPVQINVNPSARTVEERLGQKKRTHCTTFGFLLRELRGPVRALHRALPLRQHPPRPRQRRPLPQIGAEHDLKVGPQRRQFSAQRDHLIGRLSALFTGQLAA
jgi:hypothetical protein